MTAPLRTRILIADDNPIFVGRQLWILVGSDHLDCLDAQHPSVATNRHRRIELLIGTRGHSRQEAIALTDLGIRHTGADDKIGPRRGIGMERVASHRDVAAAPHLY